MNVIVVDDEIEAGEIFRKKLMQIPEIVDIQVFSDPLEAIEYIRLHSVDIAFLDIEMYHMTGIEMARKIKEISDSINIIFVTGYVQYALDAFGVAACDYLLKPVRLEDIRSALLKLRHPILKAPPVGIRIQTFGNFEVFVGGKPIPFHRSKSKEILAYLVDRAGASVTKKELAGVLWQDEEYTRTRQIVLQTLVSEMLRSLKAVNADDIIIRKHNSLSVDPAKFSCDYYEFRKGLTKATASYGGEYMSNYSWAELTAGILSEKNQGNP